VPEICRYNFFSRAGDVAELILKHNSMQQSSQKTTLLSDSPKFGFLKVFLVINLNIPALASWGPA
jgi:hypothetical protein